MLLLEVSTGIFLYLVDSTGTYGDLKDKLLSIVFRLERVQNGGELDSIELDCSIVSNNSINVSQTRGESAAEND